MSIKASQNQQSIKHRGEWASTTAQDLVRFLSCPPRSGLWGYHGLCLWWLLKQNPSTIPRTIIRSIEFKLYVIKCHARWLKGRIRFHGAISAIVRQERIINNKLCLGFRRIKNLTLNWWEKNDVTHWKSRGNKSWIWSQGGWEERQTIYHTLFFFS